jgi:hypothetical protein
VIGASPPGLQSLMHIPTAASCVCEFWSSANTGPPLDQHPGRVGDLWADAIMTRVYLRILVCDGGRPLKALRSQLQQTGVHRRRSGMVAN